MSKADIDKYLSATAVEKEVLYGPGPWQDEPDRVEWKHISNKVFCFVQRGPQGNWCGYVGVDKYHPLYGKYTEEEVYALDVHGGITYGALCHGPLCHVADPGDPEELWWLGFDCGHSYDLAPKVKAILRQARDNFPEMQPCGDLSWRETYRDLAYVTEQTVKLSDQLAEMAA